MKHSHRERTRAVISAVLSFFMTLCIALLAVLSLLSFTLFQENSIIGKMNDSYYQGVQDSLTENLKALAPPSGLPDTIFDGLFSLSTIEKDSKAAVQNMLAGIDQTVNTDAVRQTLMDRFTEYAQSNGTDVNATNLDSLADTCAAVYERQVCSPLLKYYAPIRSVFDRFFAFALIGLSVLLIAMTLFLFRIHRVKHHAVRYCIYSLFGSALMIIPIPLFLLIQNNYRNLTITPEHVRVLFISLAQTTLVRLVLGGVLVGLAGVALLPLVAHMRDQLMRNGHSR